MNATSTHDTKRGEDVRARLNVLSEMPRSWQRLVSFWHRVNKSKKSVIHGVQAPDRNDEYFIYQTLIGAWPFKVEEHAAFLGRMKGYIIKAIREAKIHTTWIRQNGDYEAGCVNFIEAILKDDGRNKFLESFLPFQKQVAQDGILNSLSQTLLKLTCPGIPDFYQGTELWDLSLVDPDNRRPVDYALRTGMLKGLEGVRDLDTVSGQIKLFLIVRMLEVRRQNPDLFAKGEYIPLAIEGKLNKYVIAFARKLEGQWAVAIVPRFSRQFMEAKHLWKDASLSLPAEAPKSWHHTLTHENLTINDTLPLADIFRQFPVAFLISPL
jgi:(1->4)-alpha-D-glucan 1-alpha-D-glucosylmutase